MKVVLAKRRLGQAGQCAKSSRVAAVLVAFKRSTMALENGWVSVFLPQAPTPMSGISNRPRLGPLSITMVEAMSIIKRIGVGSREALHGADLKLPEGA